MMLHEHFQLLRNHFVPLLPFFSPHLEVYEVGRVFPSPLPMADVTSAGPWGTWCILTNPAALSHGRPRSPQPRSCTSSGCCAPTAFSAETALGGAIDKILSFCCLQPGLVVRSGSPQGCSILSALTGKDKLPDFSDGFLPANRWVLRNTGDTWVPRREISRKTNHGPSHPTDNCPPSLAKIGPNSPFTGTGRGARGAPQSWGAVGVPHVLLWGSSFPAANKSAFAAKTFFSSKNIKFC